MDTWFASLQTCASVLILYPYLGEKENGTPVSLFMKSLLWGITKLEPAGWRFTEQVWKRRWKAPKNIKMWSLFLRNNNEVGKWNNNEAGKWNINTFSKKKNQLSSKHSEEWKVQKMSSSFFCYPNPRKHIHPPVLCICARSWICTYYVLVRLSDSNPVFFRLWVHVLLGCFSEMPSSAGLYQSTCNLTVSTLKILAFILYVQGLK